MHRVGPFTPRSARRCLTSEEMIGKGMAERDGVWYGPDRNADSRPGQKNLRAEQDSSLGAVTP